MSVITIGVDTAVVGGTGTLLLLAFGQVWARTRRVDGQRDAVTRLAMQLAADMNARTVEERDHWMDVARRAEAEADEWRNRWEKEVGRRPER